MRKELEEKKAAHETRHAAGKCVVCGEDITGEDCVETITGWNMCDCIPYESDSHYFALKAVFEEVGDTFAVSPENLPTEIRQELLWDIEL